MLPSLLATDYLIFFLGMHPCEEVKTMNLCVRCLGGVLGLMLQSINLSRNTGDETWKQIKLIRVSYGLP